MPNTTSSSRPLVALIGYTFYQSDGRLHMYVDYLVSAGYGVDVIVLENPNAPSPHDEEHVTYFTPRKRFFARQGGLQYMLDYARFMLAVCRLLLKHRLAGRKYAAIHVNNMPNFLILGALPMRLLGVRLLLDLHDTMPELYKVRSAGEPSPWLIRGLFFEEWLCMKLASYVITSEHTKRDRLLTNGLTARKSSVILNLANPALFPEFPLPDRPADPGAPFRIVYHGTLTWRLGVDTVIRAVGIAREKVPGIRYEITGDGEQRDALIQLTKELGLESCVKFSDGFVPVEALAERLRGADLGVLASRLTSATDLMLPVKLLEYIRLGIPCAAAPTKTIRRYFTEESVRFVQPDDPQALADVIVALASDPQARLTMARNARRFYDTHNFEAQRKTYSHIINELAAKRRPVVDET
jgi:glycosyltransferase involved in cell wall biosynthesis